MREIITTRGREYSCEKSQSWCFRQLRISFLQPPQAGIR
jgi:hypothetical protein